MGRGAGALRNREIGASPCRETGVADGSRVRHAARASSQITRAGAHPLRRLRNFSRNLCSLGATTNWQ